MQQQRMMLLSALCEPSAPLDGTGCRRGRAGGAARLPEAFSPVLERKAYGAQLPCCARRSAQQRAKPPGPLGLGPGPASLRHAVVAAARPALARSVAAARRPFKVGVRVLACRMRRSARDALGRRAAGPARRTRRSRRVPPPRRPGRGAGRPVHGAQHARRARARLRAEVLRVGGAGSGPNDRRGAPRAGDWRAQPVSKWASPAGLKGQLRLRRRAGGARLGGQAQRASERRAPQARPQAAQGLALARHLRAGRRPEQAALRGRRARRAHGRRQAAQPPARSVAPVSCRAALARPSG